MAIQNATSNNLTQMTGLSEAELQKRAEAMVDVKTGKIAALSALDAALVDSANVGAANMANFTAAGSASLEVHSIDDPTHAFTNGDKSDGYASEPPPPPQIGGPQAQLEKASKAGAKKMGGFCGGHLAAPPPVAAPPPPPFSPEGNAGHAQPTPPPSQDATPPVAAPTGPVTVTPPPRATITATANTPGAKTGVRSGFGLDGARSTGPTAPTSAAGGSAPLNTEGAKSDLESNSTSMQFEILKMQMQKMQQATDAVSNVVSAMTEEGMTAIRNAKA